MLWAEGSFAGAPGGSYLVMQFSAHRVAVAAAHQARPLDLLAATWHTGHRHAGCEWDP
jgi:hypothetical protein